MKYLVLITVVFSIFLLNACGGATAKNTDSGVPNVPSGIKDVSPAEAQVAVAKAYSQFIDVRTAEEYSGGHAVRAENIPLDTLAANFAKLNKNEPVYIICQTGSRSKKAAEILTDAGFNNVLNIVGGTVAWQKAGLPMETKAPHNIPSPNRP